MTIYEAKQDKIKFCGYCQDYILYGYCDHYEEHTRDGVSKTCPYDMPEDIQKTTEFTWEV